MATKADPNKQGWEESVSSVTFVIICLAASMIINVHFLGISDSLRNLPW